MRYVYILSYVVLAAVQSYPASIAFVETQNSGTTFVYEGSLQHNQRVETGSFIAFYDIGGLLSGFGPTNWSFTTLLNAPGLSNDDSRPDALFTYNGPPILGVKGEAPLGTFSLTGAFTGQRAGSYLTETIRVGNGNNTDTLLAQSGTTTVPEVPEPSTIVLLATGILMIVCGRLWKRSASANSQAGSVNL
jgi:hypothetical protein